ncbi:hypothetical protein Enr13x_51380 [Stieleria neptunia]|uniref:Leucine Rich repeats (2 copies) n=1 Tax=Stieleria neptunia TaxID=2527979 RepID=A0A518HWQ1_9BACT|nr:cytochrome d ubiquinol oxidase subunit II [Stieleria neptunia]QDV45263.1 hypothetical protein Enr13x_51380 [Stieleria neptunia]
MRYRLVVHLDALTAIAVFNAALLLIGIAALSFYLVVRPSRPLADWARKRRRVFWVAGTVYLASILVTAYFQTGWYRHGIGLFVAGLSGLIWTVFVAALAAERTIRLQTLLWLTLCLSLVFAGWTTGINRSRSRARMIHAIEAAGGSVNMDRLRNTEPTVHLPKWSFAFFDTSWDRVSDAIIPIEAFTPSAVRSWCLDELSEIYLLDAKNQRMAVDADAIAAMDPDSQLDDFGVYGGTIDSRGLELLAKFSAIESLAFDCYGAPLNSQIKQFQNLENLYLTNPKFDDVFIERIDALPKLFHLNLTDPVFASDFSTSATPAVDVVYISGSTIETGTLSALGAFHSSLAFSSSTLSLSRNELPVMPHTKGLYFYQCNLTDEMLMQFSALPQLEHLSIRSGNVTRSGQEAFRELRPNVAMDFVR